MLFELLEMLFVSTDEGDGVDLRLSRSLPISGLEVSKPSSQLRTRRCAHTCTGSCKSKSVSAGVFCSKG